MAGRSKQIHVTRNEDGWGAKRDGAQRSGIPQQPTQEAAERAAKDLARQTAAPK